MKKHGIATLALGLLLAGRLQAGLELDVRSDQPARVIFDGEYVGDAPLILHDVVPGAHRLVCEAIGTGELKEYAVYSPNSATTEKIVFARFRPDSPLPDPATLEPVPVYHHITVVQPIPPPYHPPPRRWSTVIRTPPPPYPSHAPYPPREETQAKTHSRNVLLGLTLASQLARQPKKDRVRQRNVGLGLVILNEILRK